MSRAGFAGIVVILGALLTDMIRCAIRHDYTHGAMWGFGIGVGLMSVVSALIWAPLVTAARRSRDEWMMAANAAKGMLQEIDKIMSSNDNGGHDEAAN